VGKATISVSLSPSALAAIEQRIEDGEYADRSDLIQTAVDELLENEP
jgi:Arc/MetJ-type ribon-helix-helix transcriptional regulator